MITTGMALHGKNLTVIMTKIKAPDELPYASRTVVWFDQVFHINRMEKKLRAINRSKTRGRPCCVHNRSLAATTLSAIVPLRVRPSQFLHSFQTFASLFGH